MKKKEKKLGRPTNYTVKLAGVVCAKFAEGQSMRKIARTSGMPGTTTMFSWLEKYPDFRERYEIAKAECAEMYAEEIIEIADDSSRDYTDDGEDKDSAKLNTENIQRSRLRVDARKWVASKLKPKKYGERIQQEITAPEGVTFNMNFAGSSSDDQ